MPPPTPTPHSTLVISKGFALPTALEVTRSQRRKRKGMEGSFVSWPGKTRNQASVSREKSSNLLDNSVHLIRNTHQHVQSSNPSFLISHMKGTSRAHDEKFRKACRKQGIFPPLTQWLVAHMQQEIEDREAVALSQRLQGQRKGFARKGRVRKQHVPLIHRIDEKIALVPVRRFTHCHAPRLIVRCPFFERVKNVIFLPEKVLEAIVAAKNDNQCFHHWVRRSALAVAGVAERPERDSATETGACPLPPAGRLDLGSVKRANAYHSAEVWPINRGSGGLRTGEDGWDGALMNSYGEMKALSNQIGQNTLPWFKRVRAGVCQIHIGLPAINDGVRILAGSLGSSSGLGAVLAGTRDAQTASEEAAASLSKTTTRALCARPRAPLQAAREDETHCICGSKGECKYPRAFHLVAFCVKLAFRGHEFKFEPSVGNLEK
ncbi:hypothetical protein PANDA_016727 [Ailuropoda melanoleuca]|uniref:Uncharacterized protein n=1 Tax=Ailuropoda melanoleuca TaxID=9646 RepID=D2HW97_AILME|nr:hypothetical protein PANDA_016727 [Ailuropoda melanoleuca]